MNITFMIGNGFDLNVQLETGYRSFLKYYLDQETNDTDVATFKQLISEDIEYWSALEKALGEMTLVSPLNTREGLIKCKRDLDRCLKKYLILQQNRVDYTNIKSYVALMLKSMEHFRTSLKAGTQRRLGEIYTTLGGETITYNVITFNYTNVFGRIFQELPTQVGVHEYKGVHYTHNKGKIVHVHGKINQSMIVGVNDETQIANRELAKDKRVQTYMIKPRMNALSKEMREEEAASLIGKSSIIILFGMSIGETDKDWWKCVANHMKKSKDSRLIVFDYIQDFDPTFTYDAAVAEEEVIEKFLNVAEIDNEDREALMSRIEVMFNTDMFKLNLKLMPVIEEDSADIA